MKIFLFLFLLMFTNLAFSADWAIINHTASNKQISVDKESENKNYNDLSAIFKFDMPNNRPYIYRIYVTSEQCLKKKGMIRVFSTDNTQFISVNKFDLESFPPSIGTLAAKYLCTHF
jgi:hypothetical protein